jgi:predicted dehydrogenase
LGIIGLGNIGQHHAKYLAGGLVPGAELTAVASSSPEKREKFKPLHVFETGEQLIASKTVDAVVVATPHYQHATLGIKALEQGLHLMVEKPIAAHKADAERLIAAHAARPHLVFAAMFQMRVEPRYSRIRELIQSGELGEVVRVNWILTDWYRTEAYYASGGWRATWAGEGGGVLLNQCLHNLDMLQWLLGMPVKVRGFCQFGRFHQIEVEDNVSAHLQYANGATGIFVSSTGEAPGTNRLEIAGTRGKLVLEDDQLWHTRNAVDMIEFSRTAQLGFTRPETTVQKLPFQNADTPHAILMRNFTEAIAKGEPLIAPGEDGLASVELANAILYSTLREETIDLPLDAAAYEHRLNSLIAGSRVQKSSAKVSTEDFTASFKR